MRRPAYRYSLYGLHLGSPWPLPCHLQLALGSEDVVLFDRAPDLFFWAAREADRFAPVADWFHYARLHDGAHFVRWTGLFEFVIFPGGHRIACQPLEGASSE